LARLFGHAGTSTTDGSAGGCWRLHPFFAACSCQAFARSSGR
jgi:hypothetical protein